jgi:hypothetical protein
MTNINIIGGSNNIVFGNTIGAFVRPAAAPTLDGTTVAAPFMDSFAPALSFASALGDAASFDFGASESMAAVPEPAAWTLLIAGFGTAGAAVRRSRRVVAA